MSRRIINEAIDNKIFPGCVVALIDRDQVTYECYGYIDYNNDVKVNVNTIYDVASLHKTFVTSFILMDMYNKNLFDLNDKLKKYLPKFQYDEFTINDLLKYNINFIKSNEEEKSGHRDKPMHEFVENLYNFKIDNNNPKAYLYGEVNAAFRALLIQTITGMNIREYYRQLVNAFDLNHDLFELNDLTNVAPTKVINNFIHVGKPHDPTAYKYYENNLTGGGAGLMINILDAVKLTHELFGITHKILNQNVLELFVENGLCYGDNFINNYAKLIPSRKIIGKTGFTGTFVAGDYNDKKAIVFLSNRTYEAGDDNMEKFQEFRKKMLDIYFNR